MNQFDFLRQQILALEAETKQAIEAMQTSLESLTKLVQIGFAAYNSRIDALEVQALNQRVANANKVRTDEEGEEL